MKISKHAIKRMQQRGIDKSYSSMIYFYGTECKATKGATRKTLTRNDLEDLKDENPVLWKKYRDKRVSMITKNETVITICHSYKKWLRNL